MILKECSLPTLQALVDEIPYEEWVQDILKRRVEGLLQQWHLETRRLFPLMRRHASVISGSAALAVAFPDSWQPNDLDFYCPTGEYQGFLHGLLDQGYVEHRPPTNMPYWRFCGGIKRVAYLTHPTDGRSINVIQSETESALTPVFFFHSTIVMNIITNDGVVAFYPTLTEKKQGMSAHNYTEESQ